MADRASLPIWVHLAKIAKKQNAPDSFMSHGANVRSALPRKLLSTTLRSDRHWHNDLFVTPLPLPLCVWELDQRSREAPSSRVAILIGGSNLEYELKVSALNLLRTVRALQLPVLFPALKFRQGT
jgi:hypothetical protein